MGPTLQRTAVGIFPDRSQAEFAVEELLRNGFAAEQVGFVHRPEDDGDERLAVATGGSMVVEGAEAGAAAGVAVGGLVGAAVATALLPGIGIVLAGGVLAGLLGGAAGGGILGALIGMSVPEEEARVYEREFHLGRTLVAVQAGDRHDEAVAILQRAREGAERAAQEQQQHNHRGRLAELGERSTVSVWGNPQG